MTQDCPVKDCNGYLEEEVAEDGSGFTQYCFVCEFFHHGPPYANEEIAQTNKCPMCDTELKDMHCSNCNVTYDLNKEDEFE